MMSVLVLSSIFTILCGVGADCPAGCLCKLKSVDCSSLDLNFVPTALPESAKKIFLQSNMIFIISHAVSGRVKWPASTELIDLSHNQIVELYEDTFQDLDHLHTLNLEDNNIKYLTSSSEHKLFSPFIPLRGLKYLYLDDNSLSRDLDPITFQGLQNLNILSLSDNNIPEIPNEALKNLPALQELNLKNGLQSRKKTIRSSDLEDLTSLETLILSSNSITSIENSSFSNLLALKRLDLSRNKLKDVKFLDNLTLPNLQRLQLQSNEIRFVDEQTLLKFPELSEINLSENPLSSLPTFPPRSRSITIAFAGIYFNCSCDSLSKLTISCSLTNGVGDLEEACLHCNGLGSPQSPKNLTAACGTNTTKSGPNSTTIIFIVCSTVLLLIILVITFITVTIWKRRAGKRGETDSMSVGAYQHANNSSFHHGIVSDTQRPNVESFRNNILPARQVSVAGGEFSSTTFNNLQRNQSMSDEAMIQDVRNGYALVNSSQAAVIYRKALNRGRAQSDMGWLCDSAERRHRTITQSTVQFPLSSDEFHPYAQIDFTSPPMENVMTNDETESNNPYLLPIGHGSTNMRPYSFAAEGPSTDVPPSDHITEEENVSSLAYEPSIKLFNKA